MKTSEEILNTYTPHREYNSYYHESFIIEAMEEYAQIQIKKDRERVVAEISYRYDLEPVGLVIDSLPIILD